VQRHGELSMSAARSFFAAALVFAWASLGLTAPGALEINAHCAVSTGCFAGDAAGYPVTISQPGSYVLTSNLVLPDTNTTGILVANDGVVIDLKMFSIVGVGCFGQNSDCTPASGTGHGIDVDDIVNRRLLEVRNGSIVGMGLNGIRLGHHSKVSDVRARWNRLNGIGGQSGNLVEDSQLHQNGADGVSLGSKSTVIDCASLRNGGSGIECVSVCTIVGNATKFNGAFGIQSGFGSTIRENAASTNDGDGIVGGAGSTISLNSASGNGSDGIQASNDALVQRNAVSFNGAIGLNLAADAAYRENSVEDNTGVEVSGGVNLGDNKCDNNTTCP